MLRPLLLALACLRLLSEAPNSDGWTSESELAAYLRVAPAVSSPEDELPLLRLSVARSWWPAAREVVARGHAADAAAKALPYAGELKSSLGDLKRRADEFQAFADATYRGQTAGLVEVPCALQWAQNSTHVFLGVKYAARWSAPGAIEIVDLEVNISTSRFDLSGFGHHSSIRKRYVVNLELFGDLAPDQGAGAWSSASVGRLSATLRKAQAAAWPRLTKSKDKGRVQIGKWLDMEEKWASELSKYAGEQQAKEKKKTTPAPPEAGKKKAKKKKQEGVESLGDFLRGLVPLARKSARKAWKWLRKRRAAFAAAQGVAVILLLVLAQRFSSSLFGSKSGVKVALEEGGAGKKQQDAAAAAAEARATAGADDQASAG